MTGIRKVAVIGAGVMGSGIAAHVANAGVPVLLMDIVPEGAADRNALAKGAVARMLKTQPAAFMSPRAAKLVEACNIEDHLDRLAEVDWIVEVVIERLDAKQALYRRIDAVRKPGTAVSSNTSTIPLDALIEGMPEAFAKDFLITHFFNPPRYMRLLEIVTGPKTDPDLAGAVADFADRRLGKSVVRCKDRPGFIANRLGIFWIQNAIAAADDLGVPVEEADAIMGRPFGIPKTGVFGLVDLVGLDLIPHTTKSLRAALPEGDAFHATYREMPLIATLIAEGYTGRKGKGGFYRLNRQGGQKLKEAIDLKTGVYRPSAKADLPELKGAKGPRAVLDLKGRTGAYAWRVIGPTLAYAAGLVGEASDDVAAIDEAMRLGYNWKWGPFELIDRIGGAYLAERLAKGGTTVPPILAGLQGKTFYRVENGQRQVLQADGTYKTIVRPEGVLRLEDVKLASQPLLKNGSAALWDIGDGVVCFEFTSQANALDEQIMVLLAKTIKLVKAQYKALVVYNEGSNFSVGANLGLALFAANIAAWGEIEKLVSLGQQTYGQLKYAPFPVVSAPSGMALGGGCEILLHSDAVQAHAESYIGLVEAGVGLVPAWGGCKEMLARWQANPTLPKGPMPATAKVFETVSTATVAKSAEEARDLLFLRPADGITMNRDRLLADAKAKALSLVEGYAAPKPATLTLPGPSGALALRMAAEGFANRGIATKHDLVVAGELATVLSGGEADGLDTLDEAAILDLEREGFMRLVRTEATLDRFESVIETGKPVRN
ncbi:3-hydroxyacyl-CoA dehydrogenase/enoyl-CoA hydratase family protein [Methylobacterium aerolatum]|uniref:3-hydroxyacyl-CoA dehydrogenase n=1 Tax=Methylobacterium aerolatum TaxID=418708 RepID=A0ABU0I3Q7_9HYPH|nr:3-hydroxyacyl-CoA dehydrogenase/enoyl-CoA hydratase family protein [Methylobacterium aerolatum]MDQ0449236.1 3-hydroxyacyl-CoA dehydrogenase [Methylobacterium aerolatum]GJD35422.1 putative 3-hydroxyacyl-CoA dehydrogenase [Methylobacterium aerolatum]